MPATHYIDRERKTVFAKATGNLTLAELLNERESMRSNPDFDPSFSFLMDLRDVTGLHITNAELRILAANSAHDQSAKHAYVVPSDVVFGMARIYAAISKVNDDTVQVFRDIGSARAWLGLDADEDNEGD